MLLEFQIPICDGRFLLKDVSGRFSQPYWPTPRDGQFENFFGPVKKRQFPIGTSFYSDELYYAEGKQAIKIDKLEKSSLGGFPNPESGIRRLYHDGAANVRFVIGFTLKNWWRQMKELNIEPKWFQIINDLLSLQTRVRGVEGPYLQAQNLHRIAPLIAKLYWFAAGRKDIDSKTTKKLVVPGETLLYIDFIDRKDSFSFEHKNIERIHPDLPLYRSVIYPKGGKEQIPAFFFNKAGFADKEARDIRYAVKRFHSEIQTVLNLVGLLNEKGIFESLDRYKLMDHLVRKKALLLGGAFDDAVPTKWVPLMLKEIFMSDMAGLADRLDTWIAKTRQEVPHRLGAEKQNDLENLIRRAKDEIADGNLEKALEFVLGSKNKALSRIENAVLSLKFRHKEITNKELNGIISAQEVSMEKNKIVSAFLERLEEIEE